ncbi:MAG: ABC transporter ATP-binding protein [Geminicoccaceae bacterium]|nr:ABC transporter ATP-binding protein [Geminicoccaceae bacterium]
MLEVRRLVAGYGSGTVLQGLDLEVGEGQSTALLGRNGMGRTTLVRCLMGQLPIRAGEIRFLGRPIHGLPSHAIARRGIGLVPEGRQIFPNLTVLEHLQAFRPRHGPAVDHRRIFELFPRLRERQASYGRHLSGGEQQMLAIARALALGPRMLLLDEATEGLAPLICREIWRILGELKTAGLTILLADKPSSGLDAIVDQCLVMEKGRIVWSGPPGDLAAAPSRTRLLGI